MKIFGKYCYENFLTDIAAMFTRQPNFVIIETDFSSQQFVNFG